MYNSNINVCKALMERELGGRRPGTAVQQLEVPDAHICRFSPCGQYLVCMAAGFTQLVVYRFTGPRISWKQQELSAAELTARLGAFSCFFSPLYRVPLAPAGEVLARDVVMFMVGGSLLLLASHSPIMPPPPAAAGGGGGPGGASAGDPSDPLYSLPFAETITLHLVRLSDGVRVGGSRLESELVDLSGRSSSVGICVHEDLIAVLAFRSQVIHLLQVLRGGEEVVPVRSLGPYVAEDDELVLRTAQEAEERWMRARRTEQRARQEPASVPHAAPPLRRSHNGDLIRAPDTGGGVASTGAVQHTTAAPAAGGAPAAVRHSGARLPSAEGAPEWPLGPMPPLHPRYSGLGAATNTRRLQEAETGGPAGEAHPGGGPPGGGSVVLTADVAAAAAAADSAPGGLGGGSGLGSSGGPPAGLVPPPAAVLYPTHRVDVDPGRASTAAAGRPGAGNGGRLGRAVAAADLAAAAVHQAAVRRQARQQQYDQLAAQGGPGHPPSARRGVQGREPGAGLQFGVGDRVTGGEAGGVLAAPQPPHAHLVPNVGQGRAALLLPPDGRSAPAAGGAAAGGVGGVAWGGSGGCITGIKQRLLAHLYLNCLRAHPNNPRRQQREALTLFRQLDTYRSLLMRKVYILDRSRLLIDMRKPVSADLGLSAFGAGSLASAPPGGGPGLPPSQYFLLFDLQAARVVSFEARLGPVREGAGPGDELIESYMREATSGAVEPWAESLPLWDRYVYDNVVTAARNKLRVGAGGGGGSGGPGGTSAGARASGLAIGGGIGGVEAAALGVLPVAPSSAASAVAERANCAGKLMQLLPPVSGSYTLSSSPYLDTLLFNYDERVVSPYIRTRSCLEQPVFFRLRNRPDRAMFRLDPGPYEAMVVRDRRLTRNVTHLIHPDVPFAMAVFGVFQQSTLNINFRI
ncbi:hypothetical protein VOLCADRAFT_89496 [Volvox carteri f. nagariensis]|uniref:Uncharacterized protein n=1 Tax=Volvox carteri f. nagariensis TaxID=3068 RepID=D8TRZ9_VOLCA|nr:uncharacterized protein VOLCADRAFT_89496 [Volvox carteri f. nagariensis]EFJ49606.1 hypothetical protein VOLCADRAFT_89496 [Volvox carteri f. nagariensis]|eukprot:XP_002949113.1 hypothetical protein VOLCADRAFT_89496 [Volvox carteri f. nagariensis]